MKVLMTCKKWSNRWNFECSWSTLPTHNGYLTLLIIAIVWSKHPCTGIVCVCVCVFVLVCMCVCVCVCMWACAHVCMRVCMRACVPFGWERMCMQVWERICACKCERGYVHASVRGDMCMQVWEGICACKCERAYVHACVRGRSACLHTCMHSGLGFWRVKLVFESVYLSGV